MSTDSHGDGGDWLTQLMRDFQDRLTCGLYEAIYDLEQPALETLMQAQARTCAAAFLDLTGLKVPQPLDEFLVTMQTCGPSQIEITRDGDVIDWRERHQGECVCPFVRRGVVRLDPKLCLCGAHWVERLFATVTGTKVDVEMVESAATGAQDCRFRITLRGSLLEPPR
ncbi:MAG: hypothetical protein U0807_12240 [Candidatus Binatia bacterium]